MNRKLKKILFASYLLFYGFCGEAQKTEVASLSLYEVVEQDFYPLSHFIGDRGLVLVFIGSNCPYVEHYQDRIFNYKQLYDDKGVNFVLVNSNETKGDKIESIENMRATARQLNIPYVSDQSKTVLDAFGVVKNPEVVVLQRSTNNPETIYKGALDDHPLANTIDPKDFLKVVLESLVNNTPLPFNEQHPIGCRVR